MGNRAWPQTGLRGGEQGGGDLRVLKGDSWQDLVMDGKGSRRRGSQVWAGLGGVAGITKVG